MGRQIVSTFKGGHLCRNGLVHSETVANSSVSKSIRNPEQTKWLSFPYFTTNHLIAHTLIMEPWISTANMDALKHPKQHPWIPWNKFYCHFHIYTIFCIKKTWVSLLSLTNIGLLGVYVVQEVKNEVLCTREMKIQLVYTHRVRAMHGFLYSERVALKLFQFEAPLTWIKLPKPSNL